MNKYHSEPGLKLGLGTGTNTQAKTPGSHTPASSPPMSEKTANWGDVPGKTQSRSRANKTPTTGPLGPFVHKGKGI